MDIVFYCTNKNCGQELAVDESGAGSEIECPTCGENLTVPQPTPENTVPSDNVSEEQSAPAAAAPAAPGPAPSAAKAASSKITLPKKEKSFSVPVHSGPAEVLIKKPKPSLEVAAKDADRKIRLKTIRHSECQEVGKDKFDETVTDFLQKIGQDNIIGVHPISYSHFDVTTRQVLSDFGLMIVFKG
jgi:hypothetical protein